MVSYKTVMVPVHALRRRQPDTIPSDCPGYPGLPVDIEPDSSPGPSSTQAIGTSTECSTCLSCNSKTTKDQGVSRKPLNRYPNYTAEDGIFCPILEVLLGIIMLLVIFNVVINVKIQNVKIADRMDSFFVDEFIHIQDIAQHGEGASRIPFSQREEVDEESVRAIYAVINAYEGVGHSKVGKDWRARLVGIGKNIRGPIDSVVAIEDDGSAQVFSYVRMLLDVCLIDETLQVLDHEMLIRLSVYKVENPLESPWTAQIQEHIDRVKEFDAMYCRPSPPQ
ncbi:hypothetical protein BZA77DRAFT_293799 [Pyronema omphalodes]|nr:hypothetical protein BZA77DRAFT_293799 [Pyronema omphalodes]